MGTCDGAPFLEAQLASLAAQARLPDELVIGDDASTDETVEIVETFAGQAPFPVRLVRNSKRLGIAANFASTIARCTGDLVATCDQDDLWHSDRLARAEPEFADRAVQLTFSNAALVGANGEALGRSLWGAVGFRDAEIARVRRGDPLSVLLGRRVVTGATMTVRRELATKVLPPASAWLHDAWLGFFAATSGRIIPINEQLISYRQHETNQIGAPSESFRSLARRAFTGGRVDRVRTQLAQWANLRERLGAIDEAIVPRIARERLHDRIAHLEVRAALDARLLPRVRSVARELRTGRYAGNGNGRWSALQDIVG